MCLHSERIAHSRGVSGGCFAVSWGEYSAAAPVCEQADGIGPRSRVSDLKFKEEQKV